MNHAPECRRTPTARDQERCSVCRAEQAAINAGGSDQTNAAAYVGTAMRGRMDDIRALVAAAEYNAVPVTIGSALGFVHPDDTSEDVTEQADRLMAELPLCVEATTTFEVVLGTGGPDDRLVFECERWPGTEGSRDSYDIRRVLYRYSWEGSGEVELYGEDREAAEAFARRVVPELVE